MAIGSQTNDEDGKTQPPLAEAEAQEKTEGLGASAEPGRALVAAFDPDGKNRRVFASGLRNCSGVTIRPGTDELWCVVNERDLLGDDLPPDYATRVVPGAFYGWPWFYTGGHEDPRHKGERPDLADKTVTPDVLIQPHSAPLGISFYEGGQFPAEFKGDAFVALHGSWNRAKRTGHKIIRLRFSDGNPTGVYEDFITGFVIDDTQSLGPPGRRDANPRRRAAVHRGWQWDAVAGELCGEVRRAPAGSKNREPASARRVGRPGLSKLIVRDRLTFRPDSIWAMPAKNKRP